MTRDLGEEVRDVIDVRFLVQCSCIESSVRKRHIITIQNSLVRSKTKYEGRTESHELLFFFLHANWERQTKESAVVDGTSCCVILECLVMSIACIT